MTTAAMKTYATKGAVIVGFSLLGLFLLASAAKRWQLARTVQNKISQGI